MALRSIVVAILCIAVSYAFTLERNYWVFLTAFMLITQSFGDGIYRSLVRFIMTIIGCLLGWVIYAPFAHYPLILLLISLTSLFFMLYWLTTSLIGRNLATGVLLVAAFGMMSGGWTINMLLARIQDTLVGAAIAIVVNGLILPEFSRSNAQKTFEMIRARLLILYANLIEDTKASQTQLQAFQAELQGLEKERLQLTQSYQLARYELMLRKNKKETYKNMLTQTNIVFSYLTALLDIKLTEAGEGNSDLEKKLAESGRAYYQNQLDKALQKLTFL